MADGLDRWSGDGTMAPAITMPCYRSVIAPGERPGPGGVSVTIHLSASPLFSPGWSQSASSCKLAAPRLKIQSRQENADP